MNAHALSNLPLVGTRLPHGLRLLVERWSGSSAIPLQFEIEADAPSILVKLAAQGRYYSILSLAAVTQEIESGTLASAKIVSPSIERTVCLCVSRRVAPDQAIDVVTSLCKEIALHLLGTESWPGSSRI